MGRLLGPVTHRKQWALWKLPAGAVRYVLFVDALAVVCLVTLAVRTSWRLADVLTAATFLICGLASMEVFRRIGAPHRRVDRPYNDLIAAFMFPAALLLPPVFAAAMPLVFHARLQTRVTPLPPMKRIFNAAVAVLVSGGAALAHDSLAHPLAHNQLPYVLSGTRSIVALFVATAVYLALNKLLVVGIIRRVAPATPWRMLFCDIETWTLSVADVCAGMILTLAWVVSPILLVFALMPIFLLQRTVIHSHLVAASRHDSKTGLANPTWWRQEAGRAITRTQHGGEPVAVIVLDLDNFKTVNDRFGHLRGDAVLAAVADTLRIVVRPGDLVGRFGGDEFVVMLMSIEEGPAMATAERLRARLAATISQAVPTDSSVPVTASLGVALFGHSGVDLDGLIAAADSAMYQSKAAGGNCVRLVKADLQLTEVQLTEVQLAQHRSQSV